MVRRPLSYRSASRVAMVLLAACLAAANVRPAGAQSMDSTQVARFQLADSFLRAGQYESALALLEDLYAAAPDNYAFYAKLKQAYESVKQYDKAVDLINEQLAENRSPSLLSDLARIYFLQNEDVKASETWDEAMATGPADPNTYRIVYQSMLEVRQFERAIEVLDRAREATARPDLFRTDLAYLYGLTGRHAEAMEEYLGILNENQQQLGFVRSRLSRFLEQEEALRSSIAVAAKAVRQAPLNRAFRELLGFLYIEAESYDEAFDAYRAIDRLEQENGQVLFQFAQMAADAGAYDVASEAYQEILERYPDSPSAPQALAGFGEMHERWADKSGESAFDEDGDRIDAPHYETALTSYHRFVKRYPANAMYADVLRRIGRLQQDVFFDLDAAESTLQQVVSNYPHTQAADEAEFDLARADVMRGRMEDARLGFSRLADRLRTGELAELARFKLAQVQFLTGHFDAAQTLVDVIDVNTSTDVSNDAIELKLLLMENRGPDSLDIPLRRYAHALQADEQRRYESALDTIGVILAAYPSHALADDARFMRAEILRSMGRGQAALDAFGEIPLLHPQSHLADRALFAAAEILEYDLDEKKAAAEMYTRLLSDYPGSLLASDARERIRQLRGDGV